MDASTWLMVGIGIALGVALLLVVLATRRSRPEASTGPERDEWEEALLADAEAAPSAPAQEVLSRSALLDRDLHFDPQGWDDRPDGYEGTDMGLVGGDKG